MEKFGEKIEKVEKNENRSNGDGENDKKKDDKNNRNYNEIFILDSALVCARYIGKMLVASRERFATESPYGG